MADPLWQWEELTAAAGARAEGAPSASITGFSIDTRTLAVSYTHLTLPTIYSV